MASHERESSTVSIHLYRFHILRPRLAVYFPSGHLVRNCVKEERKAGWSIDRVRARVISEKPSKLSCDPLRYMLSIMLCVIVDLELPRSK